ncbi:MAG: hypothetical protein ABSG74_10805 [Candidatus Bathyarchaeia archaeon]
MNRKENDAEIASLADLCDVLIVDIVAGACFPLGKKLVGERGRFDQALWILRQRVTRLRQILRQMRSSPAYTIASP